MIPHHPRLHAAYTRRYFFSKYFVQDGQGTALRSAQWIPRATNQHLDAAVAKQASLEEVWHGASTGAWYLGAAKGWQIAPRVRTYAASPLLGRNCKAVGGTQGPGQGRHWFTLCNEFMEKSIFVLSALKIESISWNDCGLVRLCARL